MKKLVVWSFFLVLAGCAAQKEKMVVPLEGAAIQPASEQLEAADSLKIDFTLVWKLEKEAGALDGVLFWVPQQFGRFELRGPMGITLASVLWDESGWKSWIPSEERLFEGDGERLPAPLTFGLGALSLDSLAQLAREGAEQKKAMRWERTDGWLQLHGAQLVNNPKWGVWVRRLDLPEKFERIDWRQVRLIETTPP